MPYVEFNLQSCKTYISLKNLAFFHGGGGRRRLPLKEFYPHKILAKSIRKISIRVLLGCLLSLWFAVPQNFITLESLLCFKADTVIDTVVIEGQELTDKNKFQKHSITILLTSGISLRVQLRKLILVPLIIF